jgi:hypothetical protein
MYAFVSDSSLMSYWSTIGPVCLYFPTGPFDPLFFYWSCISFFVFLLVLYFFVFLLVLYFSFFYWSFISLFFYWSCISLFFLLGPFEFLQFTLPPPPKKKVRGGWRADRCRKKCGRWRCGLRQLLLLLWQRGLRPLLRQLLGLCGRCGSGSFVASFRDAPQRRVPGERCRLFRGGVTNPPPNLLTPPNPPNPNT